MNTAAAQYYGERLTIPPAEQDRIFSSVEVIGTGQTEFISSWLGGRLPHVDAAICNAAAGLQDYTTAALNRTKAFEAMLNELGLVDRSTFDANDTAMNGLGWRGIFIAALHKKALPHRVVTGKLDQLAIEPIAPAELSETCLQRLNPERGDGTIAKYITYFAVTTSVAGRFNGASRSSAFAIVPRIKVAKFNRGMRLTNVGSAPLVDFRSVPS